MVITDEKITVTHEMMVENQMTRGNQYGIPVDPKDPVRGLRWKTLFQMGDEDFDSIEAYFIDLAKRKAQ